MINKFAVFIDGDNISCRYYDTIIANVKKHGEIFETRIFGLESKLNGWIKTSAKNFALLSLVPGSGDEATDFHLDREAYKMVLSNHIVNAYCIVSSDAHFINTAESLMARGKYVLGIGESKSKNEWREFCDIFVELENTAVPERFISGVNNAESVPDEIIEYGFAQCRPDAHGWINQAHFCGVIKSGYPDFLWINYGKKPIDALIHYAAKTGKIEVERNHPTNRLRKIE